MSMSQETFDCLRALGTCDKLDAAFLLAIATDFQAYDLETDRIEVLVEAVLPSGRVEPDFQKNLTQLAAQRVVHRHSLIVSSQSSAYWSIDATACGILSLAGCSAVSRIQLCQTLRPTRPSSSAPARDFQLHESRCRIPKSDSSTLLAIIDHGCPFAHEALRTKGNASTRVLALWDQDAQPEFSGVPEAGYPSGYKYGRQVTRADLSALMDGARDGIGVNEDLCYELAGYSAMRARWTHGAAVTGILATRFSWPQGNKDSPPDTDLPGLYDADLVFVQLPRRVPLAPSAGVTDRCVLDGVAYILQCAGVKTKHVSIVVDYGTYLGPHDGSSLFERALDLLMEQANSVNGRTVDIHFASGNGYNKGVHARSKSSGQSCTYAVDWWIPPDNDSAVFADFWLRNVTGKFRVALERFGCKSLQAEVSVGQGGCVVVTEDKSLSMVVLPHGKQWQIMVQALATRSGPDHVAVPGRCTIGFGFEDANADVQAYTTWGGQNPGMEKRLLPPRFLAHGDSGQGSMEVTGDGSIVGSACGANPHVKLIGGYENWGSLRRAKYSSAGFARDGNRGPKGKTRGVDCLAVSEESPSLGGILCMGNRSATFLRVNGTSVAAPQAARRNQSTASGPSKQPSSVYGQVAAELDDHRGEFGEPRI